MESNSTAIEGRTSAPCSPSSSDTPETDQWRREWAGDCPHIDPIVDDAVELMRKLESEKKRAEDIINHLDEIFRMMGPKYCAHPTMDGRYPCWIVWLPKSGRCERKTLKEAVIEFADQIIPENAKD